MFDLQKKINELQKKPYKVRLKILWISVIIVGIFTVVIWVITLRFRDFEKSQDSIPQFGKIIQNIKQVYEEIRKSKK